LAVTGAPAGALAATGLGLLTVGGLLVYGARVPTRRGSTHRQRSRTSTAST
jgi:hypothetical protein